MEARTIAVGNLGADAQDLEKTDGTKYVLIRIATNKNTTNQPNEPTFYTAFVYGLSEARRKLLTKGSLVYCYGIYRDEITEHPTTHEKQINRVIREVKDFEILIPKKPE